MALSSQYALQKVFNLRAFSITTGQLVLSLKKLKETNFTNGENKIWVQGGPANLRIASFSDGKTAMLSGSSALVSDELMAAQTGTAVATRTSSTEYSFEETLTISSNTATTTYTATGTAGSEIDFAYIVDANGATTSTLTQDASATPTKFTYTSGTKLLTFATGAYVNGTLVKVIYKPTASTLKEMVSNSSTFAQTLRIEADCVFKDGCSDQEILGQLRADKGAFSGAFEWSLSAGGEATVHNFEIEFLEGCTGGELWSLLILEASSLS